MNHQPKFDFDGEYGHIYDALVRRVIPGYGDVFLTILSLLEERLGYSAALLIVGPGTGMEIQTFAPARPGWRFTVVDPVAKMIEATVTSAQRLGVDARVTPFVGQVRDLPPQEPFDAATIVNVLHFVPDDGSKADLLRSVTCRLKPNSPVVLFDLHADTDSAEYRALRAAWRRYQAHHGLAGRELAEFNERLDTGMHFVSAGRMREIWEQAGLTLEVIFWTALLYGGWLLTTPDHEVDR